MLNQKGQAFSVFELMIAAVVAFAILIILLLILPKGPDFNQDMKTLVSNSIKSTSPSGQTTTGNFKMVSNQMLETVDLTTTNLDARSIFFASGQFGAGSTSNSSIEIGTNGSYVKYTGVTELTAKANVMCKQTAAQLDTSIATAFDSSKYEIETTAATACGDFMPCCIVVLERATN